MKTPSLIATFAALVGIVACAVPSEEVQQSEENVGSTSQALCLRGTCDAPTPSASLVVADPGTGSSSGGTTSGGTTGGSKTIGGIRGLPGGALLDPNAGEFPCITNPNAKCGDPDYRVISCQNPNDPNDCLCIPGCIPSGGFPSSAWNPCFQGRYTCNSVGSCRCI